MEYRLDDGMTHLIDFPVGLDQIHCKLAKGSVHGTSEGLWGIFCLISQGDLRQFPSIASHTDISHFYIKEKKPLKYQY